MNIALTLVRSPKEIEARFSTLGSREDVAGLLEIPPDYLIRLLYARKEPRQYRTFFIRKRSGGYRHISAPPPALQILQEKLNHVFQLVYIRKPAVHGFVTGHSILTNATLHVGKRWVLNVDLLDFFPSINFGRVRGMFMAAPYCVPAPAATVLAQLCCADNALPQGAPTSPIVSNMVCARLDAELMSLARRHRCTYTRYADDLSFSSRRWDFPAELATSDEGWTGGGVVVGDALRQVITSNGFQVKAEKTRLQFRDCHQEVTGITVNRKPNVSRQFVHDLRAMIYDWRKNGLVAAQARFRAKYDHRSRRDPVNSPSFRLVVKGKLEFLGWVRGRRDPVYCKLRDRLHQLDPHLVLPAPPPIAQELSGWVAWGRAYERQVFQLEVTLPDGTIRSGTAFVFAPGVLATAAHVLRGSVRLQTDGGPVNIADACPHPQHAAAADCALFVYQPLRVPMPVEDRLPERGEEVAVLAYVSVPGRQPTFGLYPGHVESVNSDYGGSTRFIQVSVGGAAGSMSGAPVIDTSGTVIGIVTEERFEQTQQGVPARGFCAALPVRHLREIDMAHSVTPLPLLTPPVTTAVQTP